MKKLQNEKYLRVGRVGIHPREFAAEPKGRRGRTPQPRGRVARTRVVARVQRDIVVRAGRDQARLPRVKLQVERRTAV